MRCTSGILCSSWATSHRAVDLHPQHHAEPAAGSCFRQARLMCAPCRDRFLPAARCDDCSLTGSGWDAHDDTRQLSVAWEMLLLEELPGADFQLQVGVPSCLSFTQSARRQATSRTHAATRVLSPPYAGPCLSVRKAKFRGATQPTIASPTTPPLNGGRIVQPFFVPNI